MLYKGKKKITKKITKRKVHNTKFKQQKSRRALPAASLEFQLVPEKSLAVITACRVKN